MTHYPRTQCLANSPTDGRGALVKNMTKVVQSMLCGSVLLAVGCSQAASSTPEQTGTISAEEALQSGYQLTPFGLMHPDCVHEVGPDVVGTHAACTHPSVAERADVLTPEGRVVPATNGWVEAGWANMSTEARYMHAQFKVPSAPSSKGSQTIFFFPSLEPDGGTAITQPVLQWGSSTAGGCQYWAIASWYVDGSGAQFSTLKRVSSGDQLDGLMQASNCNSDGSCTWTITTKDLTNGASTVLNTSAGGNTYTLAQGAVLEAYGVSACSAYPSDGSLAFTSISVRDASGAVSPDYQQTFFGASPSCSFAVNIGSTSQTLHY